MLKRSGIYSVLKGIFIGIFIIAIGNPAVAQKDTVGIDEKSDSFFEAEIQDTIFADTSANKKKPGRAALYSMVLPGLGQAYNGNYWKIPIVYSAIGTMIFWADYNNKNYHRFKTAYMIRTDTLNSTVDEFYDIQNKREMINSKSLMDHTKRFRRNRDLSIIVAGVFYLFNIIDASVDAHLSDYDIGDDITMKIQPLMMPVVYDKNAIGLSISFRFK